MSFLSRISVVAKLALMVGLALLGLLVATGGGLVALRDASASAVSLIDHELEAVKLLGQARAAVGNMRRFEKDMFLNLGDEKLLADYRRKWADAVDGGRRLMLESEAVLTDAERAQVQGMLGGLERYRQAIESLGREIEIGRINDPWAANRALEPVKGDIRAMDRTLDALTSTVHERVVARRADLEQQAATQLLRGLAVLLTVAILLGGVAWALARSITGPLRRAGAALDRVAGGDLSQPIEADGRDEMAQMLRRLAQMQDSLRGLVMQIQQGAAGVAGASIEIAQGSGELAGRTGEQASQVQRTAASMEQITGTVRQGAEHAADADRLARGATEVALRGGEMVGQVMGTMDEIEQASRRIADIIGVIDGIAFQTNILALNAAVEAARAGEQGRGFAVVAGEVRSLARRSSDAAREIRGLIGSSVERVASGGELVRGAGRTMQDIVQRVQQVGSLIGEITASSGQQSQGIEQVDLALRQIDQATQRNAALVAQSAAAAEGLNEQARRLEAAVASFRVQSGG